MRISEISQWPRRLDQDGIMDFALECAPPNERTEIDHDWLLEYLGRPDGAELQHVPLDGLIFNGGTHDEESEEMYLSMATTPPPIIVHGRQIIDGNHRVRVARRKGQVTIPAYVLFFDDEPI